MRFKVGDKVWSVGNGWGTVIKIGTGTYPVMVEYASHNLSYTSEGKYTIGDISSSLFFEEIPIPETALVRPRWRASMLMSYYYVTDCGDVDIKSEKNSEIDDKRYEFRNYFQTQAEAEKSNIYKLLNGLKIKEE